MERWLQHFCKKRKKKWKGEGLSWRQSQEPSHLLSSHCVLSSEHVITLRGGGQGRDEGETSMKEI